MGTRPIDLRYEHVTGEDRTAQSPAEWLSANTATRWHWRVPFAKVKAFLLPSLAREACSATQAPPGFFKTNNQTSRQLVGGDNDNKMLLRP